MEKIGVRIELFGLSVTEFTVSVLRLDSMLDLTATLPPDLPSIKNGDGYFFPSAIISGTCPSPPDGFLYIERSKFNRYFLNLDQSYDTFLASKSGKTRSTLRRKLRKFERESDGKIDFRIYQTPEEMSNFHDLAIGLAERTYQARLYDAALPASESFCAKMLKRAVGREVVGFLLFLAGRPAAYLYAPIVGGRIIYGFLGFDSATAKLSPGTVLQLKALEWCFKNSDLDVFDFTEGEGAHKKLFSTHSEPCVDLLLLRKNARLRALAIVYKITQRTSRAFVALLARLGLKSRIRKWLRGSSR